VELQEDYGSLLTRQFYESSIDRIAALAALVAARRHRPRQIASPRVRKFRKRSKLRGCG